MSRNRKLIISLSILVIMLWVSMVIIDFMLSTRVLHPVFAQNIKSYDGDIYRGIGYTIVIDDGYAVSPPNAKLKGYFYWGWR